MSDLTKYREDLAEALSDATPPVSLVHDWWLTFAGDLLASDVLARIIADAKAEALGQPIVNGFRDAKADERARIAAAIESLHYDAPAAKTAQATAARIARGGVQ